jgi:hypothetical protein
MRARNVLLYLGTLVAGGIFFVSDPNGGSLSLSVLVSLMIGIVAVAFAHVCRKGLFDYLDMKELYDKAKESSIGAGIVFLGICLVLFGLLGLFGNQARAAEPAKVAAVSAISFVPAQARVLLPTLREANSLYWPDHPNLLT